MNILTFDIEEWYCNFMEIKEEYKNYSIKNSLLQLANVWEQYNVKPTLFVLGSFAKENPEIIYNLAQKYDIGTHGYLHNRICCYTDKELYSDIIQAIDVLENITGKKITKYRAPGFSVKDKKRFFNVLADTPIQFDCSLSARNHFNGTKQIDNDEICIIECNGRKIKEFPPSLISRKIRKAGFFGGGYFRMYPYWFEKKQMTADTDYKLLYLHPNDFDKNQPKIENISLFSQFRRRIGLKSCMQKFEKLISDFDFTDIATADKNIDWNNVPTIIL